MGVKQRTIALLHGLGITISYTSLTKIRKELEVVGRVRDSMPEVSYEAPSSAPA